MKRSDCVNLSADLALDIGGFKSRAWVAGRGLVIDDSSLLALDKNRKPLTYGREASRLYARTSGIELKTPVHNGVFTDFNSASALIGFLIRDASRFLPHSKGVNPRILLAVNHNISECESAAIRSVFIGSGYKEVRLLSRSIAGAIQFGAPNFPKAVSMIINLGHGNWIADIVSWNGKSGTPMLLASSSSESAGLSFEEAIIGHIRQTRMLKIGKRTASKIKFELASAKASVISNKAQTLEIKGLDIISGIPKSIMVKADEIASAIRKPLTNILEKCMAAIKACPNDFLSGLCRNGITMIGGGSKLVGLKQFVAENTGFQVRMADEPELVIIKGLGKFAERSHSMAILPL